MSAVKLSGWSGTVIATPSDVTGVGLLYAPVKQVRRSIDEPIRKR